MTCVGTDSLPSHELTFGRILPAGFFARPSDKVARELIGKVLWRRGVGGGRLTEVEAYLPKDDPACHAARGMTKRNAPMFGPAGHIYVYRSYGVHILLNLVCDEESVGSAVLIRSFEPMGDTDRLRCNRGEIATAKALSCGPGRVGQALALHMGLNSLSLGEISGVYIIDDGESPPVRCTTRIGISQGGELPLRYLMAGSGYLSGQGRTNGGGR